MFYYLLLFIIIGKINAITMQTTLGECTIEVYGNKNEHIPKIVHIIQAETENLTDQFGPIKQRPFVIYIVENIDNYYKKVNGPSPEWGIAIAIMNPDRIVMKDPGLANISFARMEEVLIHEINHIYMFRLPNYHTIPSWFKEGVAMKASSEFSLQHKIEISKATIKKKVIPLSKLTNISLLPPADIMLAYAESAASIEALANFYGENVLNEIIINLNINNDFVDVLEQISGESLESFQINFELFLEENYNWIFLLRISKYVYVILPVILILGFIYVKLRNKKILDKWTLEEEANL